VSWHLAPIGLCFDDRPKGHQKGFIMNQIFTVEGMTCGHCEKAVTNALLALDAQAKVTIHRLQNSVQVASEKNRQDLAQAIVNEGYRVTD
jgi:copper chaperone